MTDYLKENDLNEISEARMISLTNPGGSSPDRNKISRAIEYAEGEVKAALGISYKLPLDADEITPHIKQLTADIAIHRLYLKSEEAEVPEKVRDALERAMIGLDNLAKRTRTTGGNDADETDAKKSMFIGVLR